MRVGFKSWQQYFPSHINNDITKFKRGPACMTLVGRRHCGMRQ